MIGNKPNRRTWRCYTRLGVTERLTNAGFKLKLGKLKDVKVWSLVYELNDSDVPHFVALKHPKTGRWYIDTNLEDNEVKDIKELFVLMKED